MSQNETIENEAAEGEKNVTMEQFLTVVCQVHAAGGSVAEAAEKLGLEPESVNTRMSQYRGRGIAVPHFAKGGGSRISTDTANNLIAKLLGKDADAVKETGATFKAEAEKRAKARAEAKAAESAAE